MCASGDGQELEVLRQAKDEIQDLSPDQWRDLSDAHCHPTDSLDTIGSISTMKTSRLCLMATRLNDQNLVAKAARDHKDVVIPFYGYHPWFVHLLSTSDMVPDTQEHYNALLQPKAPVEFIDALPKPVLLKQVLSELEELLQQNPMAMVGEIGIDRAFRLPTVHAAQPPERRLSPYRVSDKHQEAVLLAQLKLAAKYKRAASVHGVQAHGILFEIFYKRWNDHKAQKGEFHAPVLDLPPRVCLHSYSGPAEQISRWVHRTTPIQVYFSFSTVINSRYRKWPDIIKAVPADRILAETDWHSAGADMDERLQDVVKIIAFVKGWKMDECVRQLARNFDCFIDG